MGEVVPFPSRESHDPILTYQQIAQRYDRSVRWAKTLHQEGLEPEGMDRRGRRTFRLSDVEAFIEKRNGAA